MTKPLDPEIKALRAINRALSELNDEAAERRTLEYTCAAWTRRTWVTLPPRRAAAEVPHAR